MDCRIRDLDAYGRCRSPTEAAGDRRERGLGLEVAGAVVRELVPARIALHDGEPGGAAAVVAAGTATVLR